MIIYNHHDVMHKKEKLVNKTHTHTQTHTRTNEKKRSITKVLNIYTPGTISFCGNSTSLIPKIQCK